MIIAIILGVGVVLGFILYLIGIYFEFRFHSLVGSIGILLILLGGSFSLAGFVNGIYSYGNADFYHQTAQIEYDTIVDRIEKLEKFEDNELIINSNTYKNLLSFNEKVRFQKKWGTNPWTNWYSGWAYADFEEIALPIGGSNG